VKPPSASTPFPNSMPGASRRSTMSASTSREGADLRAARAERCRQVDADQHPRRARQQDQPAASSIWGFDIDRGPAATPAARSASCRRRSSSTPSSPRSRRWRIRPGLYGVAAGPSAAPTRCLPRSISRDKRDAYARTLSGGMKRRLLVAKAMVHSPPIHRPRRAHRLASMSNCASQLWEAVKSLN
jgi:hypothetical protein